MAWIPTRFIADEEITEGITVEVSLTSVSMLNKGTVWFCDEFVLLA